jgi:integrase
MTSEITLTSDDRSLATGSYEIGQVANDVARKHVFEDSTIEKSKNTLRRHRADLALFVEYLYHCQFFYPPYAMSDTELKKWFKLRASEMMTDGTYWENMVFGIVQEFKRWMLQAGYAIGSVNNRLSTVKVYSALAVKAGMIDVKDGYLIKSIEGFSLNAGTNVDEKREVKRVGRKKEQSVSVTTEQAEMLKDQPDTAVGRRDRLITTLFLEHGLRVSELVLLQVLDFDRETSLLSFYRPKVKGRAIPHLLKNGSLKAMLAYLDNDAMSDGQLLRGSRKGGRLTGSGMAVKTLGS